MDEDKGRPCIAATRRYKGLVKFATGATYRGEELNALLEEATVEWPEPPTDAPDGCIVQWSPRKVP